jgi:hypothetical protein
MESYSIVYMCTVEMEFTWNKRKIAFNAVYRHSQCLDLKRTYKRRKHRKDECLGGNYSMRRPRLAIDQSPLSSPYISGLKENCLWQRFLTNRDRIEGLLENIQSFHGLCY